MSKAKTWRMPWWCAEMKLRCTWKPWRRSRTTLNVKSWRGIHVLVFVCLLWMLFLVWLLTLNRSNNILQAIRLGWWWWRRLSQSWPWFSVWMFCQEKRKKISCEHLLSAEKYKVLSAVLREPVFQKVLGARWKIGILVLVAKNPGGISVQKVGNFIVKSWSGISWVRNYKL